MNTQTQTKSRNGNQSPATAHLTTTTALTNHPKTSTGQVVGAPPLPVRIHPEQYDLGFELARTSLSQKPKPEDRATVERTCRATARQMFCEPYDPINNLPDAKVEDEINLKKEAREKFNEQKDHAGRAVRDAKREKAQLAPAEKAVVPVAMMLLAALLIGMSLSPTFYDYFFFPLSDDPLRWACSITVAMVIGLTVTWAALRYVDLKSGKSEVGLLNGFLIGAFLLALALGGIRLANATNETALYFGIALTAMELAVMVILEFLARRFRASFREYAERDDAHKIADGKVDQALEHYNDVERQRLENQAEIDAHVEYVAWREFCHKYIDRIEEAAAQCGLLGYDVGIAKNHSDAIVP